MRERSSIQKSIALLLVLVFTISAAPKAFFHDLLANHKDAAGCGEMHHTAVLHHQGFNCHFDELVVTAPFVMQADATLSHALPLVPGRQCLFTPEQFHGSLQHHDTRGPPSAA